MCWTRGGGGGEEYVGYGENIIKEERERERERSSKCDSILTVCKEKSYD